MVSALLPCSGGPKNHWFEDENGYTTCPEKTNNGVGNGEDPQPPGEPPVNDGAGTGPGNPGNQGGSNNQGKGNGGR